MRKIKALFLTTISFLLISFLFPRVSRAANLWFSPSAGTYSAGTSIKVNVGVNTGGDLVNAVQANFTYPADKLQFSSISTSGSALSFIAEKSGGGGVVRIAGGTPSPGFSGSKNVASVYFKVLASDGSGSLNFSGDSVILKDSDNSNIYSGGSSATFNLTSTASTPSAQEDDVTVSEPAGDAQITDIKVDSTLDAVTINWNTNMGIDGAVEVGASENYGVRFDDQGKKTDHSVTFETALLIPGQEYFFKVLGFDDDGREIASKNLSFIVPGYNIITRVRDNRGNPISGAEVHLFSYPRLQQTGENGEAVFSDVSSGKHALVVKHMDMTHFTEINIEKTNTVQVFEIVFPYTSSVFSWMGYSLYELIIGVLVVIVIILLILIIFQRLHVRDRITSKKGKNAAGSDTGRNLPPMV